jgi:hypothetical protein
MADEHIVTIHEKLENVPETLIKFNVTSLIHCGNNCGIFRFDSLRRDKVVRPKAEFGNFGFGIRDRSRIPGDELRCTLDRISATDCGQNATVQRLG